jgi:ketosteroid isomerase-like protein
MRKLKAFDKIGGADAGWLKAKHHFAMGPYGMPAPPAIGHLQGKNKQNGGITNMSAAMELKHEQIIRALYQAAEAKDVPKFVSFFTSDGVFYDVSAGKKYQGGELGLTVKIYAKAFPDMHRELYDLYATDDVVLVELSLNGTHQGPLVLPNGTIPATGRKMSAPCCDVFRFMGGKVLSFNCYTAATLMLGQLGVLPNLQAAFSK